jgi:hypothetical protein
MAQPFDGEAICCCVLGGDLKTGADFEPWKSGWLSGASEGAGEVTDSDGTISADFVP